MTVGLRRAPNIMGLSQLTAHGYGRECTKHTFRTRAAYLANIAKRPHSTGVLRASSSNDFPCRNSLKPMSSNHHPHLISPQHNTTHPPTKKSPPLPVFPVTVAKPPPLSTCENSSIHHNLTPSIPIPIPIHSNKTPSFTID